MVNLKLGFAPQSGGTINGPLIATASTTTARVLSFSNGTTKNRMINWLNVNLISNVVTGNIFVRRTNPNGSTSDSAKIPLSKFQTSEDFQSNKITIKTSIFLGDDDDVVLELTNTSASPVVVDYAADFSFV